MVIFCTQLLSSPSITVTKHSVQWTQNKSHYITICIISKQKNMVKFIIDTLRRLNIAGIKFRGSLYPRNFDTFAGI